MRQMFGLMLRLMVKNSDAATMMRLNNTFQSVDPRVWDADMDVTANVGLGTGREEEKAMAYREVFGHPITNHAGVWAEQRHGQPD